jgi:hypothetical protein
MMIARWKEIARISFHMGGIRRRLLIWNLSVFGLVLFGIILASYLYTQRQIKKDRFELQAEIASLVADRIDSFVNKKMDRLSDSAVSMSLYPAGSKEQELLTILLLKNDRAFTDASILDSNGMEVIKLSERTAYTALSLRTKADQSISSKRSKARLISALFTLRTRPSLT